MSDPDESLALELIRRIDANLDALGADLGAFNASLVADEGRLAKGCDGLGAMLNRQLVAGERLTEEIDDLRRLVEEYHAELTRETGERVRRAIERLGLPPTETP